MEADTTTEIENKTVALLDALFDRNDLQHDDLISIFFTATADLHSMFPAAAARKFGLGDVPLMCAQELDIEGGKPRCIRVMLHLLSERNRDELHHVYLEGARDLRDDLPT